MKFLKAAALAAAIWLAPAAALAQTSPGWPYGYVPTAAEWNAAFAGKTDFTGSPAITASGGTLTGKLNFAASAAGTAGVNCGVGTAPASPINGDIWCTTAGMFVQINGSTIPLGTSGGTLPVTGGGTGQTSFTANLPIIGNGTGALAQGTRSGNTTAFGTVTGATTSGDCVAFDASGNLHSAGVGACGGTGGAGTVASASTGQLAIYTAATTVSGLAGCNNGYFGTNGGGTVSCITAVNATLSATITALGTIASGTWQGTLVSPTFGGTGVNNGSFTSTLAGNFTTAGAAITLTAIGATNVTLPTSGALLNQNGTSGGIPYYNTSTTVQSTSALTANLPVFGGGAGSAPFSGTRTGNTTDVATYAGSAPTSTHCAQWDASGNLSDSGGTCAGASGGAVLLATITASTSASLTDINNCPPVSSSTTGCFTNAYLNYQVVLTNIVATSPAANVGCQIQVYNAGGTYQTTGYISQAVSFVGSGTFSDLLPTGYIPCEPVGQSGIGTNNLGAPGISGSINVANPSGSGKTQWQGSFGMTQGTTGAPTSNVLLSSGWWNSAGAIVGFRVCLGTSNGTCAGTIASGTIKVYGLP